MKLEQIRDILDAESLCSNSDLTLEATAAYGSALMSDVLITIKEGALLLTALTNVQVVRTAEMSGIAGVCFVGGKKPLDDAIKLAESKNIPLLATELSMYQACSRLCKEGLPGCD
jgi:predicted transcriptional regulator